jgi:hypothetical protein
VKNKKSGEGELPENNKKAKKSKAEVISTKQKKLKAPFGYEANGEPKAPFGFKTKGTNCNPKGKHHTPRLGPVPKNSPQASKTLMKVGAPRTPRRFVNAELDVFAQE